MQSTIPPAKSTSCLERRQPRVKPVHAGHEIFYFLRSSWPKSGFAIPKSCEFSKKKVQNTAPVLLYLYLGTAKVWPYCLYPVFHQQLQKKLLCPIILLVQACRHFKECWEVTQLWRVPSEAAFIPAPPVDITVAVTILAQMSLCCVPVMLSPARWVLNPAHGQAQP